MSAVMSGKLHVAEMLLKHCPDPLAAINRQRDDGTTPVNLAAGAGQAAAVQWLIDHGADVNLIQVLLPSSGLHCDCVCAMEGWGRNKKATCTRCDRHEQPGNGETGRVQPSDSARWHIKPAPSTSCVYPPPPPSPGALLLPRKCRPTATHR